MLFNLNSIIMYYHENQKHAKAKDVAMMILGESIDGKKLHKLYNLKNWNSYVIKSAEKGKYIFYTTTLQKARKNYYYEEDSIPSDVCNAFGIEFMNGNDAPRGGALGDYVKITKKGKIRLNALRKWMQREDLMNYVKENLTKVRVKAISIKSIA